MKTKKTHTDEVELPQTVADDAAAHTANGCAPTGEESVAQLRANVVKLEDSLLRAKADFQNLQRRSAAERQDAIRYAQGIGMEKVLLLEDPERASRGPATRSSRTCVPRA